MQLIRLAAPKNKRRTRAVASQQGSLLLLCRFWFCGWCARKLYRSNPHTRPSVSPLGINPGIDPRAHASIPTPQPYTPQRVRLGDQSRDQSQSTRFNPSAPAIHDPACASRGSIPRELYQSQYFADQKPCARPPHVFCYLLAKPDPCRLFPAT